MYLCLENDIGKTEKCQISQQEMPDLSSRNACSLSVIWHFSIFLFGSEENVNVIFCLYVTLLSILFVVYKIFSYLCCDS